MGGVGVEVADVEGAGAVVGELVGGGAADAEGGGGAGYDDYFVEDSSEPDPRTRKVSALFSR